MQTALLLIATGQRYQKFVEPLLASARKFFVPHTPVLFSDQNLSNPYMLIPDEGFPKTTLHRYRTFLKAERFLSRFDQIWYSDVDMLFVAPVTGEDIFSDGITATLHPGYLGERGTPERDLLSTAYLSSQAQNKYFAGGFIGGTAQAFLEMSAILANNIETDTYNKQMAEWNDEAHLNRYLYHNPPARILTPSFCYPEPDKESRYQHLWRNAGFEKGFEPKLLALTKK